MHLLRKKLNASKEHDISSFDNFGSFNDMDSSK